MAGYGTDDGFAAWIDARGLVPPGGVPGLSPLRQLGSDYVDSTYGSKFGGVPTGGISQERAWPRLGAYHLGVAVPNDVVPPAIINASYEAAYQEYLSPGSLKAFGSSVSRVKREKVEGAVEVEYQASAGGKTLAEDLTPVLTTIEGMLAPYLARPMPGALVV